MNARSGEVSGKERAEIREETVAIRHRRREISSRSKSVAATG
jgi:hypothetical protein